MTQKSSPKAMNRNLCIFCQDSKIKQKTCDFTSESRNNKTFSASKYIEIVSIRVAGVTDLTAPLGCCQSIGPKKFLIDITMDVK